MKKELSQRKMMKLITWDYHYDTDKCIKVLLGELEYVGDLEHDSLFKRLIYGIGFNYILNEFDENIIKELLSITTFNSNWEPNKHIEQFYIQLQDALKENPNLSLKEYQENYQSAN